MYYWRKTWWNVKCRVLYIEEYDLIPDDFIIALISTEIHYWLLFYIFLRKRGWCNQPHVSWYGQGHFFNVSPSYFYYFTIFKGFLGTPLHIVPKQHLVSMVKTTVTRTELEFGMEWQEVLEFIELYFKENHQVFWENESCKSCILTI